MTKVALDMVMAAAEADGGEDEEPELLLGLPAPKTAKGRALVEERKRGRPAGAKNKRTVRTVQYLMQQFRDPRAVLLSIAGMDIDVMMATLGLSAAEALAEKRLAAQAVLPYVASKMPLAVEVNQKVVNLSINLGGGQKAAGQDGSCVMTLEGLMQEWAEKENGQ